MSKQSWVIFAAGVALGIDALAVALFRVWVPHSVFTTQLIEFCKVLNESGIDVIRAIYETGDLQESE